MMELSNTSFELQPVAFRKRQTYPTAVSSSLLSRDSEVTPTLSVGMPTLNDEDGVADYIDAVERAVEQLGVTAEVIVSDSSTDRTPEIAQEKGAIVVEPDEPGYGYAYRYAFLFARGEYIAIGDADTIYDFEALPRLLELVVTGDADIAMGSRLEGEIEPGAMPLLHRYVGNPLLTKFLNTFYDVGVTDAHSGLRVLSRDALETLELGSDGMEFASEMVMDAGTKGLRIEEVPITYRERKGEATLSSFRDEWRHVHFMLVNAPTYLFTIPAIGFGSIGILMMILSLLRVSFGGIYFGIHMTIAASLVTIMSYQIGSLTLFSSIVADPIREQQDPVTGWIRHNVDLEHALTFGVSMFAAGIGYLAYLVIGWVASTELPFVAEHMIGFTAVVLGSQTIFIAFFLRMLGRQRSDRQ